MVYTDINYLASSLLSAGWSLKPNGVTKGEYEIDFFNDYGDSLKGDVIIRRYGDGIRVPLSKVNVREFLNKIEIDISPDL